MKTAIAIAAACAAGAGCGGSPTGAPDAAQVADAHAPDARAPDAAAPDAAPDAMPGPDLTCLGQAAPTTAPDPLVATGKVFSVVDYQIHALAGAPVVLRRTSDGGVLASSTTAADGSFAVSVASGGAAVDAYYVIDDGVHRPTYVYLEAPLTGTFDALIVVADDAELARWYTDAGDTWDATARTVIAQVVDCAPKAIAASVTASPAPAHRAYYDPAAHLWSPGLDASPNGYVLLTRAAASEAITAHAGGADYPVHQIAARPGALTLALVPPTD
jgi:hypothetical protein